MAKKKVVIGYNWTVGSSNKNKNKIFLRLFLFINFFPLVFVLLLITVDLIFIEKWKKENHCIDTKF